jgi:hypothetical protein
VAIGLLSASRCAFHNHMHLDRTNNASKNDCENANTLARDDETLVVLATLRWRWSLSGRERLGSSLPPASQARWDSGVFRGIKTHIFLYANVEIWRRCHVVFHELKHVLKCYTYLV